MQNYLRNFAVLKKTLTRGIKSSRVMHVFSECFSLGGMRVSSSFPMFSSVYVIICLKCRNIALLRVLACRGTCLNLTRLVLHNAQILRVKGEFLILIGCYWKMRFIFNLLLYFNPEFWNPNLRINMARVIAVLDHDTAITCGCMEVWLPGSFCCY